MAWSDDGVQRLRELWDEGRSAAQIAAVLGGVMTRNAVIGKAHRLRLPRREPLPGSQAARDYISRFKKRDGFVRAATIEARESDRFPPKP